MEYGTITPDGRFRLHQKMYATVNDGVTTKNPNTRCMTIGRTGEHLSVEKAKKYGLIATPAPPSEKKKPKPPPGTVDRAGRVMIDEDGNKIPLADRVMPKKAKKPTSNKSKKPAANKAKRKK